MLLFLGAIGGATAVGGLSGCTEELPRSQKEAPESKVGEASTPKSTLPKAPVPSTVNPDGSNRGIKGKYAD
jgi:hypothetical protein